jgi:hypothetical protein
MGRFKSQENKGEMADDEAHHQAVQEIVNQERSSIAPFGTPSAIVTRRESEPATETVPDIRTWGGTSDQQPPRPPNLNTFELGPFPADPPWPASPPPAVSASQPEPSHLRAAATALGFATGEEQPDYPQPSTSPGVQDQPAAPSIAQLQGTVTTMHQASAGMSAADATSVSDTPAPHVLEARGQVSARSRASAEARVKKAKAPPWRGRAKGARTSRSERIQ